MFQANQVQTENPRPFRHESLPGATNAQWVQVAPQCRVAGLVAPERGGSAGTWRARGVLGNPRASKYLRVVFFSVVVPALELSEHFFWSRGLESILEHDLEGRAG